MLSGGATLSPKIYHDNYDKSLCWLCAGGGLLITLALLCLAAPYDLEVSLALSHGRDSFFGWLVQDWGKKPVVLFFLAGGGLLATKSWRLKYPVASGSAAGFVVQYFLHSGLITNIVKLLVGRPRPVDCGVDGAGFVPFHRFAPGFGDFSFPSGHVAIAMSLAPCVVVLWRAGQRAPALAVAGLTLLWAGAVAYGRVLSGAHCPTDVLEFGNIK